MYLASILSIILSVSSGLSKSTTRVASRSSLFARKDEASSLGHTASVLGRIFKSFPFVYKNSYGRRGVALDAVGGMDDAPLFLSPPSRSDDDDYSYGDDSYDGSVIREKLLEKKISVQEIRKVLDSLIIEDDLPIHYGKNVSHDDFKHLLRELGEDDHRVNQLRLLDKQVVLIEAATDFHDLVFPFIHLSVAAANLKLSGDLYSPIECVGQGEIKTMKVLGAVSDRCPDGRWEYELMPKLLLEVGNSESIVSLFDSIDEYFRYVPTVNAVIYVKIGGNPGSRKRELDATNLVIGVAYREGLAGAPSNCAVSFGGVGSSGLEGAIVSAVATKTLPDQFTGVGRANPSVKFSIYGGVFFDGFPDIQVDLNKLKELLFSRMMMKYL